MKMLYCHDGPLFKDENGSYYSLGLSNEVFERYNNIVDEIKLLIRVTPVKSKDISGRMTPITLPNIEVIEAPNLSTFKGITVDRVKLKKSLIEEIKDIDYIFSRIPSHIGNVGVDVAKELKIPYMVEVVACPWDSLWNYSIKGKLVAPYFTKATKNRVKHAQHAIYVTNEFLQKRYPTDGKSTNCSNVILTSVDSTILQSRLDKINQIQNSEKVVIGTTASLDIRFKGQQYIIEALGKLKKIGITNFEYQLVGKGDPNYLLEIAKKYDVVNQIKILGPKKHDDVFKWLDTIDVYAQPSRQEGLPRAVIEAMSRGLLVIGAATGGIPELISPDYVFSNSKTNIEEIVNLLSNITKEDLVREGTRNFEESKQYLRSVIEERRQEFLKEFVIDVTKES